MVVYIIVSVMHAQANIRLVLMLLKGIIALYLENNIIHFGLDIFCGQKEFCGFFFSWLDIPNGSGPPLCLGFEITLRHTTLVGILWTRHRPVVEKSDYTQHSQRTGIHNPDGIRIRNPRKRASGCRFWIGSDWYM